MKNPFEYDSFNQKVNFGWNSGGFLIHLQTKNQKYVMKTS